MDVIGAKLDILTTSFIAGTKMAREAITDILKLIFNLLLHYPKVRLPQLLCKCALLTLRA